MKEPAPGSGAAGRTGEGGERRGAHLREGLGMGWGELGRYSPVLRSGGGALLF